jgi:hypothetical protein
MTVAHAANVSSKTFRDSNRTLHEAFDVPAEDLALPDPRFRQSVFVGLE